MAALSADKTRDERSINKKTSGVFAIRTSHTLYVGSLAAFTTIGRVQAAAAATNLRPAGVVEQIINDSGSSISAATGNASGTVKAVVSWGHEVLVPVRTAARTFVNLGKTVYIASDDDVTDTTAAGTAAVRVAIGSLTEFTDATNKDEAWVALRVYGDAAAT